ncbi:MAG: phosphoenolpyruvate synthase [Acidobacteriota bacterium]|nr:phosphoenolpyruvate synthase [Acidobacteriota bacterium]
MRADIADRPPHTPTSQASDQESPQPRGRHIRWFRELSLADVPLVGGKNASLGEMVRELGARGVRVPDGFATVSDAFRHFLAAGGLDQRIRQLLDGLDVRDLDDLRRRGRQLRHAVLATPLPDDLERELLEAYDALSAGVEGGVDVAVRSSATAEDLPEASFAGQQETYLNVRGHGPLLDTCRRCFASLFTDRAISYRAHHGFDQLEVALSVGVQRMVRSDLASSGVMFSIDTETGFRDAVLINSAYGLGENVVQGAVNPDEFYIFKPTLREGKRPILRRHLGTKEFKLVYDEGGSRMTKNVPVAPGDRARFSIADDELLTLARWAMIIEDHYSAQHGRPTPMDMEWAKDGLTGELFIVQARPETVQSQKQTQVLERYQLQSRGKVLTRGRAVGELIGSGPVRVIANPSQLDEFQRGEVLVTDKTDPDWEPVMKRAAAIVTNRGGRTCHAAIVSRELGVPAIVGTEDGTEALTTGQMVTISCAEGDTGYVYEGELDFTVERTDLTGLERPRTEILMNVADPTEAFRLSFLPCDGVGLAREEFIISNSIQVHPQALLDFDRLEDDAVRRQIREAMAGYDDPSSFFVDRLAEGVGTIAAAFYPRPVIVRLSDFKTNEYAHLIGGAPYEPAEENPMLGYRGASRYYDERYREAFGLECQALRKVREDFGLTNVKIMVPFCRTPEEGRRVQAEMARHGLQRGENGLELYIMCEIPSNVVLAEEFAQDFDGFSIGSNDLTQLTLGVDRDSELIAHLFDERNEAVMRMVAQAIRAAKAAGRKIGICGQAPSDYPDFARFLIREGIDSISLNPDAVLKTTLEILDAEKQLDAPAE